MAEKNINLWSKSLNKLASLIKSKRFYYVILIIFVLESIWVAVSSVYPMAFDEQFHLGIIQFYAHHLNPFITSQPPSTYVYGAITRDPSYLYQYLMSFPYRLISLMVKSAAGQVILMRFINIVIFTAALVVFKKFFDRFTHLSSYLVNMVLLFFILTPIVPQMAGQINYDALFILSIASTLYLFFDFINSLNQTGQLNLKKGLILLSTCFLASLVKYAFLPIFLGLIISGLIWLWIYFHGFKPMLSNAWHNFRKLSKLTIGGLLILLFISFGLFAQRDIVNLVNYHTPVPQCNQVLTVNQCEAYGPWNRNYQLSLNKNLAPKINILQFTKYWFNHAIYSMTFVDNGPASGYSVGAPFWIIQNLFTVSLLGSLILFVFLGRKVWHSAVNKILIIITVIYLAALWLQNFSDYRMLGVPVAIQGRYWIPILIPILILLAQMLAYILQYHPKAKIMLSVFVILLLLQGGGVMTFIARSNQSWYWQNSVVDKMNSKSREVLKHVVISRA